MSVHKSGIRKGEIADRTILANCWIKIKSYTDKLNNLNIESWTVKEIKQFLTADTTDLSFSDFARKYIDKMRVSGRRKPAGNYTCALNSIEKHYGKSIFFQISHQKNCDPGLKAFPVRNGQKTCIRPS
jgi:hypothetical protein